MFGRCQRREERLYWKGFRDALVVGRPNPSQSETGVCRADEPRYRQGFEDGKHAAKRIHRDALVAEVRKLSLAPGDTVVIKLGQSLSAEVAERIKSNLEPRFPENTILVLDEDVDLSTIERHPLIVQTVLDGKVVAEAVARAAEDEAARS